MNGMRYLLFIVCFLASVFTIKAQELRCSVSVSGQQIKGANQNMFQTMQRDLYEFMNNKKWTNHLYDTDERIKCNIYIRLTEQVSSDEFKGTINVQLKRPVFNASYETTVLNIKDEDFHIRYVEFQQLEFDEKSNKDNLTNIMAYYAYVILGFDYDTFSPLGGTEYFEKARQIVNNSQSARERGWKPFEKEKNRYWLVENILNKSYSSFRDAIYRYHRKGLDIMSEKQDEGRSEIVEALRSVQKVYRVRSYLYITRLFFDAKVDEIANLFTKSFPDEKNRVMAILNEVDPSNGSKYDKILKSSGL
ncbi:DUF4835 family protein [Prolixibacteraceae bacterium JC049]|nr:DUF4835 family protein [Prolixibacteraceae bacterium JC049]